MNFSCFEGFLFLVFDCRMITERARDNALYKNFFKVTDGTPCDQYGHDLCVDGTCIPVSSALTSQSLFLV